MNKPLIIETKNVTKVYVQKDSGLRTNALTDINISIEQGNFVSIAGPSGSGKTTLLNILGCLDRPTTGEITVDGVRLSSLKPHQAADLRLKKIGFVFQAYNLIPTLTALENTEYVALLQGMDEKHRQKEAAQILKDLGLGEHLHKRPSELSAGQQQRVAVARAILVRPKIVLADEPTANLDSKTGAELIDLMRLMSQTLDVTFVFATHDKMVMEKTNVTINLHDGKIVS